MAKEKIEAPEGKDEFFKKLLVVENELNKKLNIKNSIIKLGDKVGKPLPSISSGFPTFDWELLQCGGVPKGRIIEIFGPESSGKTTICLHLIAQAQKAGGIAAIVDAEHALDPNYAKKLGVNVDELLVSQPDCGEDALTTVEDLVKSNCVDIIIVDSVAALVPRAELEGEMGDSHMGLQARLMSQAMRKLTGAVAKSNCVVIFINQIREKIGVMFGSPETTTGGRALKFYSSVRLDVRRKEALKEGDAVIGHRLHLKAVKNKVGTPLREMDIDLIYESGLDMLNDKIDYAVKLGVLEKAGTWYSFKKKNLSQGKNNLKDILSDNESEITKEINAELERILSTVEI